MEAGRRRTHCRPASPSLRIRVRPEGQSARRLRSGGWRFFLDGLAGRSHASQGEQRTLALALELSAHQLATERLGTPPLLLLDDVFSELDPQRSDALVAGLPSGQALITTAFGPPSGVAADKIYRMVTGRHASDLPDPPDSAL